MSFFKGLPHLNNISGAEGRSLDPTSPMAGTSIWAKQVESRTPFQPINKITSLFRQFFSYDPGAASLVNILVEPKKTITDTSLIGTETKQGDRIFPIYWTGTSISTIFVNDQPGVVTDVAVAFSLTGDASKDANGIFVTLISPSGIRIPIAGTKLDPNYLSYRSGDPHDAPTLNLKAQESKGYIFSESEEDTNTYSIDESFKNRVDQGKTQQSLASLVPLTGTEPNGTWQLEVKNSSDVPIQLDNWQLFLKSSEQHTLSTTNGEYNFSEISPSTTVGAYTPWISIPTDRLLLSPIGKINTNATIGGVSPSVSFGLSPKDVNNNHSNETGSTPLSRSNFYTAFLASRGDASKPSSSNEQQWNRFDHSSLINPSSLHPKTTLSQAVTALEADAARAKYGVNGKGVRIGLLSSTFNAQGGANWDYQQGLLDEAQITILLGRDIVDSKRNLQSETNDEGRSMAQNIHSIAPGAEILFHSWYDEIFNDLTAKALKEESKDEQAKIIREAFALYEQQQYKFKEALIKLAEEGCKIIVDDLDDSEPYFEDGPMAQAISFVKEKYGVTYFTAAGNSDNSSYTSQFNARGLGDIEKTIYDLLPAQLQQELQAGHELHLFEGSNGSNTFMQKITKTHDPITMQWNSKWGANDKSVKVLIFDKDGNYAGDGLLDPDGMHPWSLIQNPNKKIDGTIDHKSPFSIAIVHSGDSSKSRPGVIKWIAGNAIANVSIDSDAGIYTAKTSLDSDLGFYTGTATGHANGPDSANVGSVQYWSTTAYRAQASDVSRLSSWGGTPIYFDSTGKFLSEPVIRETPAFIVPQKGNTSFFSHGYTYEFDSDRDFFQNFEGTSSAAPNAAAVAALMLQLNPTLTPDEIISSLKITTNPAKQYPESITYENGFNNASGYGLINAMAALDQIAQLKLSGTVYEDSNGDGRQNPGETGLEGIQVFLDSNGNGRFDQNSSWQSFTTKASGAGSISETTKPTLIKDKLTGLLIDSRYNTIIHGTDSLRSDTPFSERSLLISTITSSSDFDVIIENDRNLTLDGDLMLQFNGPSRSTNGTYSILNANSIKGSFDNIWIEGLDSMLYFDVGIEGGNKIQVTVSDTYFLGSIQAGSLY